jgi:hypothetical protein
VCVRVRVHVRGGVRVRVRVNSCRNAELSGIRSVRYRTEKTNDAGTGLVPDQAKAVWPMPSYVALLPINDRNESISTNHEEERELQNIIGVFRARVFWILVRFKYTRGQLLSRTNPLH